MCMFIGVQENLYKYPILYSVSYLKVNWTFAESHTQTPQELLAMAGIFHR